MTPEPSKVGNWVSAVGKYALVVDGRCMHLWFGPIVHGVQLKAR